MRRLSILLLMLTMGYISSAQDGEVIATKWYSELGFSFSHFEQQVKQEVGGAKGDLLVDETTFSIALAGGYHVWDFLSVGAYLRYDSGTRVNGQFGGFDSSGGTIVSNPVGGDFSEIWVGPYARLHWKKLFFSVGYGLVGERTDDGRTDTPSTNGTFDTFSTDPSVALIFNVGGKVDISDDLGVFFGLEYRARYYNQRGGNNLVDDIVLGTQNITPLVGVQYGF